MIEDLKKDIEKLIALYEGEKSQRKLLSDELARRDAELDACRKQITELTGQVDSLKLASAFSGSNPEAKAMIDGLIREVNKCINLLER